MDLRFKVINKETKECIGAFPSRELADHYIKSFWRKSRYEIKEERDLSGILVKKDLGFN